jgi:hypothetical protein
VKNSRFAFCGSLAVKHSLDFSNRAHAGKLSAMRFGVNAAKLSAHRSGVSADRHNFLEN